MSVKIRLQRHGRKQAPYYHIVAADSRSPRDGKYIELLGFYKPQTIPATIEIDVDKALTWLENGAQPTETCHAILSYKGVLMKKHLLGGVKKGAFSMEVAMERLEKWLEEKQNLVAKHQEKQGQSIGDKLSARLAAEAKVNADRAAKIAAKKLQAIEAEVSSQVVETPEEPEIVAATENAEVIVTPKAEAPTAEAPIAEAPTAEAPIAEAPEVTETKDTPTE